MILLDRTEEGLFVIAFLLFFEKEILVFDKKMNQIYH